MKKAILRCLCLIVSLQLICTASAANKSGDISAVEENSIVTYEEYCEKVQNAFSQYGVTSTPVENDENIVITRAMLQESLDAIHRAYAGTNKEYQINGVLQPDGKKQSTVSTQNAPVTMTSSVVLRASLPPGTASIRVVASLQVDVANNMVMSVNSCTSYAYGSCTNFVSWKHLKYSTVYRDYGSCTLKVTGRMATSYTDPVTGVAWQNTSDVTLTAKLYV